MKNNRPALDLVELEDFVYRQFKGINLTKLAFGNHAYVYSFTVADGKHVIRISMQKEHLLRDSYMWNEYGAKLKVPEFLEFGSYNATEYYAVTKYVAGRPVCRKGGITRNLVISDRLKKSFTSNMMDISVTPVRGSGFGEASSIGVGRYDSWHDFLITTEMKMRNESYVEHVKPRLSDDRLLENVQVVIEKLALHSYEKRHLVHGDYQSYNVIARYGKIAANLDWANMMWGDFAMDIFITTYFENGFANLATVSELCDEYRRFGFDMDNIENRLLVCKLKTFASWLFTDLEAGKLGFTDKLQTDLSEILKSM